MYIYIYIYICIYMYIYVYVYTVVDMVYSAHSTQPALRPHRTSPRVEDKQV